MCSTLAGSSGGGNSQAITIRPCLRDIGMLQGTIPTVVIMVLITGIYLSWLAILRKATAVISE